MGIKNKKSYFVLLLFKNDIWIMSVRHSKTLRFNNYFFIVFACLFHLDHWRKIKDHYELI